MARVVAFLPDLMFGSRVQADLTGAGHEVEMVSTREAVERRPLSDVDVLVVDLTDERLGGAELVEGLVKAGRPDADAEAGADVGGEAGADVGGEAGADVGGEAGADVGGEADADAEADVGREGARRRVPRTLGFYSHVETAARTRAERAGFDLVVPRSRMAREGPRLVSGLAGL